MQAQSEKNIVKFHHHSASLSNGSKKQRAHYLNRLLLAGPDAASDCEILESILLVAPAPISANTLAVRLLERFGSFNDVIHADTALLKEISGVDSEVLKAFALFRQIAQRMIKSEVIKKPTIGSFSALMDYCKVTLGHQHREEFHILYLNHAFHIICAEKMQWGTVNHTPVYPRDVIKRALLLSAGSIILVHNHPSGDPTPSSADIDVTNKIIAAANVMNIDVNDHIIITDKGHYSFASFGLIPEQTAAKKVREQAELKASKKTVAAQYELFPELLVLENVKG